MNVIGRTRVLAYLRTFLALVSFLVALDASIALNRWWLEGGFETYAQNLLVMTCGFVVFSLLISRSKVELVGIAFFCVATYFICNFEIGGESKYYLTPFDPMFGVGKTFPHGLESGLYRKSMAIVASFIAAAILAFSRHRSEKGA